MYIYEALLDHRKLLKALARSPVMRTLVGIIEVSEIFCSSVMLGGSHEQPQQAVLGTGISEVFYIIITVCTVDMLSYCDE